MNVLKYALLTALVAFGAGFWTGCSVGLDAAESDTFSCTTEDDCIAGNECVNNLCRQRRIGPDNNNGTCVDVDGDGFGVNANDDERLDCVRCVNPNPTCEAAGNCCAIDCNDNDANIRPNVPDRCDTFDNDCDGDVDETNSCQSASDCPQPADFIPNCVDPSDDTSCEAGDTGCVCRIGVTSTLGKPAECKDLSCAGGTYDVPQVCQ